MEKISCAHGENRSGSGLISGLACRARLNASCGPIPDNPGKEETGPSTLLFRHTRLHSRPVHQVAPANAQQLSPVAEDPGPTISVASSLAPFSFLFQVSHRKMLDGATPLQILEDPGSFGAYQIGQVAPELFLFNRMIDDLG